MAKNKIDLSGFKGQLEKYCRNVCRITAGQIRDELTEEAMYSIAAFYSDYSPIKYKRHYYNFMDRSYKKYYSNAHNTIYRGGVEFTPDSMADIYTKYPVHSYSPAEVFSSVVESGIHGPELLYRTDGSVVENVLAPLMDESPMEMVLKKKDEILAKLKERGALGTITKYQLDIFQELSDISKEILESDFNDFCQEQMCDGYDFRQYDGGRHSENYAYCRKIDLNTGSYGESEIFDGYVYEFSWGAANIYEPEFKNKNYLLDEIKRNLYIPTDFDLENNIIFITAVQGG